MARKGDARRALLVRAAADVLHQQGFEAVTHRAVAARAGLPPASTSYYFATAEDLLGAAVDVVAQDWLDAGRARLAQGGGDPAARVLDVVSGGAGPGALLVLYQRYLAAARRPALQATLTAFDGAAAGLVGQVLAEAGLPDDDDTARLVLATADGLLLGALARGSEDPATEAAPPLARLLRALEPGDPGPQSG